MTSININENNCITTPKRFCTLVFSEFLVQRFLFLILLMGVVILCVGAPNILDVVDLIFDIYSGAISVDFLKVSLSK